MPDVPRVPLKEIGHQALFLFLPTPWFMGWLCGIPVLAMFMWPDTVMKFVLIVSIAVGIYLVMVTAYQLSRTNAIFAAIEWHTTPTVVKPGPNRAPKPILYEPELGSEGRIRRAGSQRKVAR